ncbi:branched-chain amino acid transport system II carrier protein [Campylobacter sputorum subsp. sputorum]|nr:branched-chain amino acid transport system II carrier protein [Campylobacter sputorum subsp. sputorum]
MEKPMTKISKKQFLVISLMLFSMFFGAGNFIFPPMLGKEAGVNVYEAILFFCITGVALPVLGIAAVAKSHSMDNLVRRVDPYFAMIFTILIYITIGPAFAIPRAANMPFEVTIAPFISTENQSIGLFVYTLIYFIINYLICINPSKMVEMLGKILTPLMLILIVFLFISNIINPIGEFGPAVGKYASHPIASGFLAGYETMDALASLVFGIVVINAIKNLGLTNNRVIVKSTIKSGILAGAILMSIYMMLAYIGASTSSLFPDVKNGAALLSNITNQLFGGFGVFVLGTIFLLACITTTVGLISSASEFFSGLVKNTSYKFWVITWSFLSFCVANVGLNALLTYSIPVLIALYPITIVLIILALINNFINSSKLIYRTCVYVAVIMGIVNGFDAAGIKIPMISEVFAKIPFYDIGLGWIIPEILCLMITYIIHLFRKKDGI